MMINVDIPLVLLKPRRKLLGPITDQDELSSLSKREEVSKPQQLECRSPAYVNRHPQLSLKRVEPPAPVNGVATSEVGSLSDPLDPSIAKILCDKLTIDPFLMKERTGNNRASGPGLEKLVEFTA